MAAYSILPCGTVTVSTGNFKYGNFYGFWGDDMCYEVYKTDDNKIRVVATSGVKPLQPIGSTQMFKHDQTGRYLFTGVLLEAVVGDVGFKSLKEKYENRINIAIYK